MAFLAIAPPTLAGDGRPAVIRPMVDNRFRRGLGDVVAMVAQHGICVADVADVPFDEALRRTGIAAMLAYKWAYHDPTAVAAPGRDARRRPRGGRLVQRPADHQPADVPRAGADRRAGPRGRARRVPVDRRAGRPVRPAERRRGRRAGPLRC